MNYIFKILEQEMPNGSNFTMPNVIFLDNIPNLGKFAADIIFHDDIKDIDQIIESLHVQLSSDNIEPYTWGYEIYSVICDGEYCRCHDNFSSTPEKLADAELILPTSEVLQLMIDWRAFVVKWRVEYLGQDPNLFV
jgi:hypothetical protein